MTCHHTIHKDDHHLGWNNAIEPVLSLAPGETIEIQTIDASGGQLHPKAQLNDLTALDFDRVNPVTGPVYVEGAEPGDAVAVTFCSPSAVSRASRFVSKASDAGDAHAGRASARVSSALRSRSSRVRAPRLTCFSRSERPTISVSER